MARSKEEAAPPADLDLQTIEDAPPILQARGYRVSRSTLDRLCQPKDEGGILPVEYLPSRKRTRRLVRYLRLSDACLLLARPGKTDRAAIPILAKRLDVSSVEIKALFNRLSHAEPEATEARSVPDLAKHFDVSERQIRNLLERLPDSVQDGPSQHRRMTVKQGSVSAVGEALTQKRQTNYRPGYDPEQVTVVPLKVAIDLGLASEDQIRDARRDGLLHLQRGLSPFAQGPGTVPLYDVAELRRLFPQETDDWRTRSELCKQIDGLKRKYAAMNEAIESGELPSEERPISRNRTVLKLREANVLAWLEGRPLPHPASTPPKPPAMPSAARSTAPVELYGPAAEQTAAKNRGGRPRKWDKLRAVIMANSSESNDRIAAIYRQKHAAAIAAGTLPTADATRVRRIKSEMAAVR